MEKKITEKEFYQITSLLTPQSRSPLWQNYFIKKHNYTKVSAQEDRGDCCKEGKYYEYKASGFNEDGDLHIVQIRLWQHCDYIIQSIRRSGFVYTFRLTHAEMKEEVETCNAQVAHGTQKAVKNNENIELRMTIELGGEDWNRWIKNYHSS